MKRRFFTLLTTLTTIFVTAQEADTLAIEKPTPPPALPAFAKKLNIDLFFRGGGVSDNYNDASKNSTHFVIDNARINLQGDFNDDIFYRVRFRPNRPFTETSQDGGTTALDYAFITYRFGAMSQWDVTVGKQLAVFGAFD